MKMRAAVLHGKEDVRIEEVDVPGLGPGEILLKVGAALTCGTDAKVFRRGYHARMITPPAVFGHEVAGTVEARADDVKGLNPGDRVVVANSAPCGTCDFCRNSRPNLCDDLLFWNGAYAEFARIPARIVAQNVLRLPDSMPFSVAALAEPLGCVLRGVEAIPAGCFVAVIGTGPIGLMFVALLRKRGAHSIAVGRRASRLERARDLGAEVMVRIEEGDDLSARIRAQTPGGRGPDVVVEAAGAPETCRAALAAVRKGGLVNLFAGCPSGADVRLDLGRLHYEELTVTSRFHHTPQSFRGALELLREGQLKGEDFVTGEASLERLPEVLGAMRNGSGLKTAILPAKD